MNSVANCYFVKQAMNSMGYVRLSSLNVIRERAMKYGLSVKENKISQVRQMLREGTRFSATTDRYTNLKNRRYININLHGKDLPRVNLYLCTFCS